MKNALIKAAEAKFPDDHVSQEIFMHDVMIGKINAKWKEDGTLEFSEPEEEEWWLAKFIQSLDNGFNKALPYFLAVVLIFLAFQIVRGIYLYTAGG